MAEDVNFKETVIEVSPKEKALTKTLVELIEERELAMRLAKKQSYTYLDAVARQGSHVGLPTTRP